MKTWSERRNAAIKREAAAVLSEVTKKYGPDVAKHLPRTLPPKWTVGDPGPSANQRRAIRQLKGDELACWVEACEALAGREVTFHQSHLDAMFDRLPADKLAAIGPPPADVEVESLQATMPSESSGATSTPGAAPQEAAGEPAKSKPSRSAAPWTKLAEHREALRLLGPSSIPHQHAFVDGTCTTCRTICICPPEKCIGGACQICGKAVEQSTCQHRWAGSPPRCLRCRKAG